MSPVVPELVVCTSPSLRQPNPGAVVPGSTDGNCDECDAAILVSPSSQLAIEQGARAVCFDCGERLLDGQPAEYVTTTAPALELDAMRRRS